MANKVEMWRSDNGRAFDTEHQALREDLRALLIASNAVNEASAEKLATWLCDPAAHLNDVRTLFDKLAGTHPEPFVGTPHDVEPEA